jgi:Ran GTPase-activating protein (RanGAP) involved in mRNA processing and transport
MSTGSRDIQDLDIDGVLHNVEEGELVSLFDALRKNRGLTTICLRHVELTRTSISALVPALKNSRFLRDILIEEATDVDACLPELLAVALFFNRSIKKLALRSCWAEGVSPYSIGSMLNTMLHLEELQLCHSRIDEEAACAIGVALKQNNSLKMLDLTGSAMNCDAVCQLSRGLAENRRLVKVILDFNSFGDNGCAALARMLERNSALEELHFFGNRVTAKGATLLAQALTVNCSLRALELSFNRIGDEGVIALAECLTINTTLEKIWFPSNSVGCDGLIAFADHLPKMKGLRELYVGLLLDDDIEDALAQALKENLNLSVLHLEKPTELDEESVSSVAKGMDFYLRCNKSGRRLLRERNVDRKLWSSVLARASANSRGDGTPDVLHYMIRSNPVLCEKFLPSGT